MQQEPSGNREAGRRDLVGETSRGARKRRLSKKPAIGLLIVAAMVASSLQVLQALPAQARPDVTFTLNAVEYDTQTASDTNTPVLGFRYLVTPNDVGDPADPDPMMHPGMHPMSSTETTISAEGRDANNNGQEQVTLPEGKYLISVQDDPGPGDDPGHRVWGQHIEVVPGGILQADGTLTHQVNISMIPFPLKLGKIDHVRLPGHISREQCPRPPPRDPSGRIQRRSPRLHRRPRDRRLLGQPHLHDLRRRPQR